MNVTRKAYIIYAVEDLFVFTAVSPPPPSPTHDTAHQMNCMGLSEARFIRNGHKVLTLDVFQQPMACLRGCRFLSGLTEIIVIQVRRCGEVQCYRCSVAGTLI